MLDNRVIADTYAYSTGYVNDQATPSPSGLKWYHEPSSNTHNYIITEACIFSIGAKPTIPYYMMATFVGKMEIFRTNSSLLRETTGLNAHTSLSAYLHIGNIP